MSITAVKYFGGLIRWIFQKCKTKLQDEVEGNLDAKWCGDYDIENYIIGYIALGIVFLALILMLSITET